MMMILMILLPLMMMMMIMILVMMMMTIMMILQGDTERLAKFKIRIEDPPRRKDMVMFSSLLSSTLTESYRHGKIM